jgi:hypothetical protein
VAITNQSLDHSARRFLHCHEIKPPPKLLSFGISLSEFLTFLLPEDANLRKEISEYLEFLFGVS